MTGSLKRQVRQLSARSSAEGSLLLALDGLHRDLSVVQGPFPDLIAAGEGGELPPVHIPAAGDAEDDDLVPVILLLLQLDHQRPGRTAPGDDADRLLPFGLRFDPFLRLMVLAQEVVDELGQVLHAEGIPDQPLRLLRRRDEAGGCRQRQGSRLVPHDHIHLLFGQEALRLFPELFLNLFHSR